MDLVAAMEKAALEGGLFFFAPILRIAGLGIKTANFFGLEVAWFVVDALS
jgi:hypothetical protein